jgi:hypothetical protein
MWHHHFFSAHIIESIAFHLGDGPFNCAFQILRTTETIANVIGQMGEPLIRLVTGQGGANDARCD